MTIEPLSAPYTHPSCTAYDLCRIRDERSGCDCARIDALLRKLDAAEKVMGEANDLIASATPTQMLLGGFIIEGEKHAALANALEVYAALGEEPA